jgi:DNA-binding FadR family transcriptional regulator
MMEIDPTAAGLAAERATSKEIDELASAARSFENADSGDIVALVAAEVKFHRLLIASAKNPENDKNLPIAIRAYHGAASEIRLGYREVDQWADDHRLVLRAVQGRDPRLSRQLMVSHLWRIYDYLRSHEQS